MFKKLLILFAMVSCFSVYAEADKSTESSDPLFSSTELVKAYSTKQVASKEDFGLKSHHEKLQLECSDCHVNSDKGEYKRLETNDCLQCHNSTETVAKRTQFMDVNHTNPHNSLHDGLDLDCYECHAEHKPSQNLCSFCHNTTTWMGQVP